MFAESGGNKPDGGRTKRHVYGRGAAPKKRKEEAGAMNDIPLRDRIPTRFDSLETWRRFRETVKEFSSSDDDAQFAIGYTDHMIARLEQEKTTREAR